MHAQHPKTAAALPAHMKALFIEAAAGPFVPREIPLPQPGAGEVLVRVAASGVNPLDTKIRAGKGGHARHPFPAVLGLDLAGTVVATGSGVSRFRVGDEVFGMTGGVGGVQGSLAEYAAVDAHLLALKPPGLSMREAAALPLVFITAWEGLVDRARVSNGHTVLVHGGAGGVGHIAVQVARAFGAKVYATASATDFPTLAALGAIPIDYRTESVEDYVAAHTGGEGFDIVYDTVGGATLDASFAAARVYRGHVVSVLGWGTHALGPLSFRAATYSGVFTLLPLLTGKGREHHGEILAQAAFLYTQGVLKVRLDPQRFGLVDIEAAHALVATGRPQGKVVVELA
jgi:NADPH:quinone reductase